MDYKITPSYRPHETFYLEDVYFAVSYWYLDWQVRVNDISFLSSYFSSTTPSSSFPYYTYHNHLQSSRNCLPRVLQTAMSKTTFSQVTAVLIILTVAIR